MKNFKKNVVEILILVIDFTITNFYILIGDFISLFVYEEQWSKARKSKKIHYGMKIINDEE